MDENCCSVCLENMNEYNKCILPGCKHCVHTSCMITLSQYDVRCPLCRSVPLGVKQREAPNSFEEPLDDDTTILLTTQRTIRLRRRRVTVEDNVLRSLRRNQRIARQQHKRDLLRLEQEFHHLTERMRKKSPTFDRLCGRVRSRLERLQHYQQNILQVMLSTIHDDLHS